MQLGTMTRDANTRAQTHTQTRGRVQCLLFDDRVRSEKKTKNKTNANAKFVASARSDPIVSLFFSSFIPIHTKKSLVSRRRKASFFFAMHSHINFNWLHEHAGNRTCDDSMEQISHNIPKWFQLFFLTNGNLLCRYYVDGWWMSENSANGALIWISMRRLLFTELKPDTIQAHINAM